MTLEQRAKSSLVDRLRKASGVVCPSVLHARLHSEAADALEAALNELATLRKHAPHGEYQKEQMCLEVRLNKEITILTEERDTARARLAETEVGIRQLAAELDKCRTDPWLDPASADRLRGELTTARAQVKTLAEALRWYAGPPDSMTLARAALKAAGVET